MSDFCFCALVITVIVNARKKLQSKIIINRYKANLVR